MFLSRKRSSAQKSCKLGHGSKLTESHPDNFRTLGELVEEADPPTVRVTIKINSKPRKKIVIALPIGKRLTS